MSLISETFIVFMLLLIGAYYTVPKRFQWICLLFFSSIFYAATSIKNCVFIFITAFSAYLCALKIDQIHKQTKAYIKENKKTLTKEERSFYKKKKNSLCRTIMILTLLLNIGFLCLFKYSDFALEQIHTIFPESALPLSLKLIVPLGISFYTFQTIGYVVDVYWEKVEPQSNFAKMLLFVSFFPQVTQGPISEYSQLGPQLFGEHSFSYKNFSYGVQRMMWGFFKKMVIADRAAPFVQTAFAEYASMNGNNVLFAAFLYSLQIYADFSGYMDIVCGLCEILGIQLTENFERPYFSKSVAEYWRRWHSSLGTWFKTYIYYPVAVSKFAMKCSTKGSKVFGKKVGNTIGASIALIVVWFTTGFWHGASWAYIAWGGLNGLAIIFTLWMEPVYERCKAACKVNESSFAWRAFSTLRTFFIVTLIKVFPEVGSFRGGVGYWMHCFQDWDFSNFSIATLIYPIASSKEAGILMFGAFLMFVTSLLQRRMGVRDRISKWPMVIRYTIFVALFFAIVLWGIPTQNAGGGFLYEQF